MFLLAPSPTHGWTGNNFVNFVNVGSYCRRNILKFNLLSYTYRVQRSRDTVPLRYYVLYFIILKDMYCNVQVMAAVQRWKTKVAAAVNQQISRWDCNVQSRATVQRWKTKVAAAVDQQISRWDCNIQAMATVQRWKTKVFAAVNQQISRWDLRLETFEENLLVTFMHMGGQKVCGGAEFALLSIGYYFSVALLCHLQQQATFYKKMWPSQVS